MSSSSSGVTALKWVKSKRPVEHVGGAVVAGDLRAPRGVDLCLDSVADLDPALQPPFVEGEVRRSVKSVLDRDGSSRTCYRAGVADLSA